MCDTDWKYKRKAMSAAKQLGYGDATVERIKASNSVNEIARIMTTTRLNMPWRQTNDKRTRGSYVLHT